MGLVGAISTTMAIFSLKQLGWSDKQDMNIKASATLIIDDKQIDKRIKELELKMKQSRLLQEKKKKSTKNY